MTALVAKRRHVVGALALLALMAGALLAAMFTVALAQSTNRPDVGVIPGASQEGPSQRDQGQDRDKTRNHTQAQPQGSTGPIDTTSGGAPASSPEGDTPPGMQAKPKWSSGQGSQGAPSGR